MTHRSGFLMAIFAATLAAGPACRGTTSPEEQLSVARRHWAQSGLATYSISVLRGCECTSEGTGPVLVIVRDGAIVSRTYVSTGASVSPDLSHLFPDVEGLFDLIETALGQNVASLKVTYHPTFRYPEVIAIDYDTVMADDEVTYDARDLRTH